VEDVTAGGEAAEVLVGERAKVLVADGADRPCGGHGGAGIQGCAALLLWSGFGMGNEEHSPPFISRDGASSRVSKMHNRSHGGTVFPLYNYLCFSLLLFVLVIQLYFQ
jgi:hypothetical protein